MQNLYGKKTTPPPTRAPSPDRPQKFPVTPGSSPGKRDIKLCNDPKIDAITTMSDANTYAFKG